MHHHSLLKQGDGRFLAQCRDKGRSFTTLEANIEQEPGHEPWVRSNCLCLPRSQCLHLSNGDKLIKLSTLLRALSASIETLDLQVFYTPGEAIGGLGKISVRDVLNLMAKCHFYLWNIRCRPNLKIHLLLQTHETSPCLTRKLLRFTLCPHLLSPYVFRVSSRLLSLFSQLILINKQGNWCSCCPWVSVSLSI